MSKLLSTLSGANTTNGAIFLSTVIVTLSICYYLFGRKPAALRKAIDSAANRPAPRNFTLEQLKEFRGQMQKSMMGVEEEQPVYLAVQGEVYNVSEAKEFYGPDGVYGNFAGHDVTRALALNSLDPVDLDNDDVNDLTYDQAECLAGWVEKYKYYKQYPVVGRLIKPPTNLQLAVEDLRKHNGAQDLPSGYATPPIYIGIRKTVYDMSYGGTEFYGPGGPYHFLAGRDGSRALAKMSFLPADAESRNLSDLEPAQFKTLNDWEDRFRKVRKYPIVGRLTD